MAKIPTEWYIYILRVSAGGTFTTNSYVNLTRKDTGEGLYGKEIFEYMDGVVDPAPTGRPHTGVNGYPGPLDLNPSGIGLHPYYVEFRGDAEFEACRSEEIILKIDPNLTGMASPIEMNVTPVSGDAPLTIHVTGKVYAIGYQGAWVRPAYPLPLDLVVSDATSTKHLQAVKTVMSNPDGTYAIDYTFIKPGEYRIIVGFLGDDKYASLRPGVFTKITVTGEAPSANMGIYARDYATKESLAVPFTINDVSATTPYTEDLELGSYTVKMPVEIDVAGKHYKFKMWMMDADPNPTKTIEMVNVGGLYGGMAAYEEVTQTLTITTTTGGTTEPAPESYTHPKNATVKVTAIPGAGYNFDHWIMDGVEYTTNPINVIMDTDHTITAYFSEEPPPPPETYKLNVSSTTGGATDPAPGIYEYEAGVTATVTAIPDEDYHFNHWTLDGATRTENPINITMNQDYTLLAVFSVIPPTPTPRILATVGGIGLGAVIGYASKPKKPLVRIIIGAVAGGTVGFIIDRLRS